MALEEKCQMMKKPCSALATQWSVTYLHGHSIHTGEGQEGYRGTTCTGVYGVSRQGHGEANCEKWEMSGCDRSLRIVSIEMEKPEVLHSCLFSVLELFNRTGCRQGPAGRY